MGRGGRLLNIQVSCDCCSVQPVKLVVLIQTLSALILKERSQKITNKQLKVIW